MKTKTMHFSIVSSLKPYYDMIVQSDLEYVIIFCKKIGYKKTQDICFRVSNIMWIVE